MRICIVGCGIQGTGLAGLLSAESDVEQVVLVDNNAARVETAVATLSRAEVGPGDSWVKTALADAGDPADVAAAAQGCDLLLNATIPALNLPLMKAALAAGAHYIDLYSLSRQLEGVPDSETVEAQLELDGEFKTAGLTAFPCLGMSPGFTTLAARYIAAGLDEVKEVVVRNIDWIESRELIALATPEIMLGLWLGAPGAIYLEGGEVRECDLIASEETYEFPAPVGRREVYIGTSVGDAVLISMFAGKPIARIVEKGAVLSGGLPLKDILLKAIQQQTCCHEGTEDFLRLFGSSFTPATEIDVQAAIADGSVTGGAFSSVVEATGTRGGRRVRHTMSSVTTLEACAKVLPWATPGVFATVGSTPLEVLLMLCRGELTARGVLTVADLEDPLALFARMGARGHVVAEKIETAL